MTRVPSVVEIERLRVRQVGEVLFVDLVVAVSRTLPLDRVAVLKNRIVEAVRFERSAAEVTVTTEPRALDDETVLERVMVTARNRALAVHHVTVHEIEGRLAISLDLEVDGLLSLGAAHDIASGLEDAIREELGPEVEVDTHIEPLQPYDEPGREAPPERITAVHNALSEIAAKHEFVRVIHDVRVREAEGGEIVNFHCVVDADAERGERARRGRRGGARVAAALSLDQTRARTRGAGAGLEIALRRQHGRALQAAFAQVGERVVGRGKRIARDLGLHASLGHDVQEFSRVRAREVCDRHDMPLLPQQAIGEARNVRHVDAAADDAPTLLHRLERQWNERADRGKDDSGIERLGRHFI